MSGIGHGTLWILADPSNETPMGYIFEPSVQGATSINSYVLDATHLWAITVGRYKNGGLGMLDQGNSSADRPSLMQNVPNPVKTVTSITYTLPFEGQVSLRIYSMSGALVSTLVDETQQSGSHSSTFTIGNLPAGSYSYTLYWEKQSLTRKMIVLQRP